MVFVSASAGLKVLVIVNPPVLGQQLGSCCASVLRALELFRGPTAACIHTLSAPAASCCTSEEQHDTSLPVACSADC